ncbi:Uncharacterised protein [Salmonella enterica subsp. arizonae]|uniref:Uncharacterized protein n=1 Tax=Salmonella enterica subsp. arizonae TaxID=59203 RepID=A0A379SN35_SALER|nr:Uncharacterised protein [Salmonella enterica subsp. arizonae]
MQAPPTLCYPLNRHSVSACVVIRDIAPPSEDGRGLRNARRSEPLLSLTSTSLAQSASGKQSSKRCRFCRLIFFAPDGAFITPVIAGANTVLPIIRVLRRKIAVIAQHLAQRGERGRSGNMTYLTTDGINRQRLGLIKTINLMAVRQDYSIMAGGFT